MAGYGVRRVQEKVTYEVAKQRVIALLEKGPAPKSVIGFNIWPGTKWRMPQGAAFAAAKIVRKMEDEGLVRFSIEHSNCYELAARRI